MHVFGNGALAGHRCALQPAVSTTARGRKGVPNGESAAARLIHPWDVKVDKLATIMVANRLNHRLRKLIAVYQREYKKEELRLAAIDKKRLARDELCRRCGQEGNGIGDHIRAGRPATRFQLLPGGKHFSRC